MEISRELQIEQKTVSRTIKRFNELGTFKDRERSGRPRTARTPQVKRRLKQKIRRNPKKSKRQHARDEGISERSVRRIVKEDLGLTSYKQQEAQDLDENKMRIRKERCQTLLRRFQRGSHKSIVFSDEKLFTVEEKFNKQNVRIIAKNIKEANKHGRIVKRKAHPKSVMVWGAITADGKSPLVFVEEGVKVNAANYRESILEGVLQPWASEHFGRRRWCFQQDSAPAHKACVVQQWCRDKCPDFIDVNQWPPYSPDLNPLDYSIWAILEAKVNSERYASLAQLHAALQQAWDEIGLELLASVVENWRKRMRACVKANGGYFEF